MKENKQKIKLIKITEYLKSESSKDTPLSTNKIIKYLNGIGITCDRRTLYRDMNTLSEQGVNVVKTECGRENGYYIEDNSFSLAEIKVLIDAVQSANFITDAQTIDLTKKLLSLSGTRKNEAMVENIIFYNAHKHSNEDIYNIIEQIERAIENKKQIMFYYFDLDEKSERVYRKDKKRYTADPIALIFDNGNYYLLSYSQKYKNNTIYRLDRMSDVSVEDTDVCNEAIIRKRTTENYTKQVFKMYGNTEVKDVVLELTFKGMGIVYDKFGEDTKIKKVNDKYIARVKVQPSPPFYGWLLQYSEDIKLIEPQIKYDFKKILYTCLGKEIVE